MATPNYQIWVATSAYAKVQNLKTYQRLEYSQTLNGIGSARLAMHPNDPKIADCDIRASDGTERIRRLLVYRDGVLVFGGLVERVEWSIPDTAPREESWVMHAVDGGAYLSWRLVIPAAGQDVYAVSDAADDAMKAFVYNHAGAGAGTGRPFTDLSVAADASAAATYSAEARYEILLNVVNEIAAKSGVYWRMTPGASGHTFTTAYPLWGVDRTQGNGVNSECIFTFDRRNFLSASWYDDRLSLANYIYVGGQGEGSDRTIVERSNATSIAACYRRERFADARQMTLTASLQNRGDAALAEMATQKGLDAVPLSSTWKATSGTTWDLGDKVSVFLRPDYGGGWRDFSAEAVIKAIAVTVEPEAGETVRPELAGV